MKHRIALFILVGLLLLPTLSTPAEAQNQTGNAIVTDVLGLLNLQNLCSPTGFLGLPLPILCTILEGIDAPLGQNPTVFLVQPGLGQTVASLLGLLDPLLCPLQLNCVEPDYFVTSGADNPGPISPPPGLSDTTPVNYYGTTAWHGYVNQPAATIINLAKIQSQEGTGAGTVAVIDTGVDPQQPVLQGVLLKGHDFIRNQDGGDETQDVNNGKRPNVTSPPTSEVKVTQWAAAVIDPCTTDPLCGPAYPAFGHGTMVAGIVHLVAPTARIMPLKAFDSTGKGKLSDVLRAIYYGTKNGANILNMSFDFTKYSSALNNAFGYANQNGVVSVAAVGNNGEQVNTCAQGESSPMICPAGLSMGNGYGVVGLASTSNNDVLSSFSNYGAPPVWVGAPGEAIVTTYPYGTYAAGWGTSFSTPFVSGAVALMRGVSSNINQQQASDALENAANIGDLRVGYGRLDAYKAVMAWCHTAGKC